MKINRICEAYRGSASVSFGWCSMQTHCGQKDQLDPL